MAAGFYQQERQSEQNRHQSLLSSNLETDTPSLLMLFSLLKASHNLYIYVHSSIIHKSQQVEATQMLINR